MKFSELTKTSRLNEASSFKYGALNFTIKKQSEDFYKLLYTSGPMKCEIFLNVSPDEGEINITLSDYVEWFNTPQLKSLTKLLKEITDGDIIDVYKFVDLAGIIGYKNRRYFIDAFNEQGFEAYAGRRGTTKWIIEDDPSKEEITEYGARGGCGYEVLEKFIDNYSRKHKNDIKEIIKVKNEKYTIIFNDGSKLTFE